MKQYGRRRRGHRRPACTSGSTPSGCHGTVQAAAFDTRMDHPKLLVKMDHASRTEEKLLTGLGARLARRRPSTSSVIDATGPLADGEEERASRWGRALAENAAGLAEQPQPRLR